jgi:hypothetical protein
LSERCMVFLMAEQRSGRTVKQFAAWYFYADGEPAFNRLR